MQFRLTTAFVMLLGIAATSRAQPAALPRPEQLTGFDPATLKVECRTGRWVIAAGQRILKDCGRREQEAYQVCRLIQQLGLNQQGVIGAHQPVVEYWLAGGTPPSSLPRGLRMVPISLSELRLEQAHSFWVLREPTRVLFNFGTEEQEARQALAVIQKYGFNRVGVIGQGVPLMLLFVADSKAPGGVLGTRGDARTLSHRREPEKKGEPNQPAAPKQASFYPTPILPPVAGIQPHQPTALLDRGKPSRNAAAPMAHAVPEAAMLGASPARATFDYRQTLVRRDNGVWVLAAGGMTLARFGGSERHARQAHMALMHYRLTEVHLIGPPEKGLRYFLSAGQTPRGLMVGIMGDNFQPDQASVHQTGENFFVAQRGRMLLNCGPKEEDARQMLAAIRRHRFDHICHIGPGEGEGLTLLVKSY